MKVSILNLVPLRQGESYKAAMERMVNLAKKAEELGYTRYWIAEHHNTHSVASSATQLLIQYALSNTEKIRIGSGGVMLPNHSPYLVAEQYGTLETLYPGRVDLGLGRAPGTDLETARAIRRGVGRESDFEREVMELSAYFRDTEVVHAYPAAGLNIPLYILGSSTDSAYLAARLGLPYSFAAHFAPTMMETAIRIYQENFKPSDVLEKPYVILGANAILADTKEEAESLATTQWQAFLNIITNQSQGLLPPVQSMDEVWRDYVEAVRVPHFGPVAFTEELIHQEKRIVERMGAFSFIGTKEEVQAKMREVQERVHFDELIVNSYIYEEKAQHYSYQLLKEALEEL